MSTFDHANTLAERVKAIPGGDMLMMCYSCGTCTSRCMVQNKQEEAFNPRRLIRKAVFDMEAEAFSDETTWLCTACDLCFPACPQKIHISGVIHAVKALAVENGQKTPYAVAAVDQKTCVACGLCAEVCPYNAIELVTTRLPFRGTIPVAKVDAGKCMACGMCTAACRSTSIRLDESYNDSGTMQDLWQWLQPVSGGY